MSSVRIREVAYTKGSRGQLGALAPELHDACLEELRGQFEGQELGEGEHVSALLVGDEVVRANLFADRNGILWVESVRAG